MLPRTITPSVCVSHSSFISWISFTFPREGFCPYGPQICPTTIISFCPNANFSLENVKPTPSNLCSTFLLSLIWSETKLLHPCWSKDSSLFESNHTFIGISSSKGIVMFGIQSPRTLFIALLMWALNDPFGNVHIRTNPLGVRILVLPQLSRTIRICHTRNRGLRLNKLTFPQRLQQIHQH